MFSRIRKIVKEYRELKYLAYHDSLTGLLNRNWLYKNIDQIKTNYVYFIDINDLRKINENGHTAGDEYIKNIVNSVQLGENDIFVRYAGDEFILFSNEFNMICLNEKVCVGVAYINNNITEAINIADMNMLKSKLFWKTNK